MLHHRFIPFYFAALLAMLPAFPAAAAGAKETKQPEPAVLTVYTYDAFPEDLEKSIAEHMQKTYGVRTELKRYEDAGGLYTQLYLERRKPAADVMIGLDGTYLSGAFSNDLLVPYKPAGFTPANTSLVVDPQYRAVPFDYGAVVLNYNSEQLPDPPQTWEELLSPALRGKIIMMNPATSSPGRNFLLFTVAKFGPEGYLEFWRKLKPNILTVTAGWSEGYGLYTQGEAPIVLSYDASPAYHIEFENDRKYRNLIIGGEAYAQVEVSGIVKGTDSLQNARRLMDFLVTKEFQSLIPLNQFMYPVRADVEIPGSFREAGTAEKLLNMDEATVSANFGKWLADWEAVMRS